MSKDQSPGQGKKIKIRGGKKIAEDVVEANENHIKQHQVENPVKRLIKLNQFAWTEKQKEFLH